MRDINIRRSAPLHRKRRPSLTEAQLGRAGWEQAGFLDFQGQTRCFSTGSENGAQPVVALDAVAAAGAHE